MARKANATGPAICCPACGMTVNVPTHGERVRAGIRRAQRHGIRLGRPPTITNPQHVRKLRAAGLSIRSIAKQLNVPKSTVADLLRQHPL